MNIYLNRFGAFGKHIIRRVLVATMLVCVATSAYPAQDVAKVVTIAQINLDKACGPRCISALMKLTQSGKPDATLEEIYALIGKKYQTATNMLELKRVLEKFGFHARGFKLEFDDLAHVNINDYMILPVGKATGTAEVSLHFILGVGVTKTHILVADTRLLRIYAITLEELANNWNGHVLIISAGKEMKFLPKKLPAETEGGNVGSTKYDEVKDFGRVQQDTLRHTFIVHRASEGPCQTKIVRKNCACLNAKLGKDDQGNHTLNVELKLDHPGPQEASVVVFVNPGKKILRYSVRAHREAVFTVTPIAAYMTISYGDKISECEVSLDYYTNTSENASLTRVHTGIPGLTAGAAKTTCYSKGDDRFLRWKVPLRLEIDRKLGETKSITGTIEFVFQTKSGEQTVPMAITIDVDREACKVIPSRVFLMPKDGDDDAKAFLRFEFPVDMKVSKVHYDATLDSLEFSCVAQEANVYNIKVMVTKEKLAQMASGFVEGSINIKYRLEDQDGLKIIPVGIFN